MATVKLDLYVNVTERKLVLSATNPANFTLPDRLFTVGDKISIRMMLVERVSFQFGAAQLSQINPSGFAVKVGVGAEGSTTLTEATSVTVSGNYMSLTLDLSTTEFSNAVTAGTATVFYIKIQEPAGDYQTVFSAFVIGKKNVTSITTTPAVGATYRTKDEADAIYAKKIEAAGVSWTLTSPDGTKAGVLYWGDDGSFHADSLS